MGTHTLRKQRSGATAGSGRWHTFLYVVVPIFLVIIGLLIMLAPVVTTTLKNADQQRVAQAYSELITELDTTVLDQERARAHEWNSSEEFRISGDPWMVDPDEESPAYQRYLEQLDLNPVMARLFVPTAGIDLPVYHGTSEAVLSRGVGHLFGTAMPVGGVGTHTVLTGHTGIATSTLFDNLIDVQEGDLMSVEALGDTLVYKVTDIQTVLPEETESIRPVADRELLTLITCTPYGINSHRLLVTGERVFGEEAAKINDQSKQGLLQWWMYLAIGLSALIILIMLIWLLRRRKGRK